MLGMAKKMFLEKGGRLPLEVPTQWPQIFNSLPYVDYALAESLLRNTSGDEGVAALIGYLSLAAREGHLCINVSDNRITPSPFQLCDPEGVSKITSLILEGVNNLPQNLFTDVSQSDMKCPSTPICRLGNLFYLQRYWRQESTILDSYKALLASSPSITLDRSQIEKKLADAQLLPEQLEAIYKACTNSLSLICGGPGTGKTYTAGELIKIFWSAMTEDDRKKCQIALAAPTGKAAANLQKSLCRAISNENGFPPVQAKTLHSLLGIRDSSDFREPSKIFADLILVDESSMIDVHLMQHLLTSVKKGARLILLGDRHQLPPVGAGMLFSDLMEISKHHCTELRTCLRAELKGIVDFATAVNNGDKELVLKTKNVEGIHRLSIESTHTGTLQKAIVDYACPYFSYDSPQHALESFSRFRILCPLRQGPFGVDLLNEMFVQRMMREMRNQEWFVAPILLVANDNRQELSNGEVGVLVRRMPKSRSDYLQKGDYAIFPARDGNSVRKLPALLLPKFEYAFCLSVHKSQGSEFDRVLLLMPEGSERFGREIFYTAVTRVRKQLDIWGRDDVLLATMDLRGCRLSGLKTRMEINQKDSP